MSLQVMNSALPHVSQALVSPSFGGAERVAIDIASAVTRSGRYRSSILCPSSGDAFADGFRTAASVYGYQIDRLHSRSRTRSGLENLRLSASLRNVQLLHCHAPFVYAALRGLRLVLRPRSVVHVHLDYGSSEGLQHAFMTPPEVVVLCADYLRQNVEKALESSLPVCVRPPQVKTILNYVDEHRFRFVDPKEKSIAKVELGVPPDQPLAAIVANLSPHKGQETAMTAIAVLMSRGTEVALWIVGSERLPAQGYASVLREKAAALGIEHLVRFTGNRNDVDKVLAAADFKLLPSTNEGLPLSLLEAQAAGAVVVAAPTAGIPEIIEHGSTGFMIPANEAATYADVIDRALRDVQLRSSIARTARAQVESRFSHERFMQEILSTYDELLSH